MHCSIPHSLSQAFSTWILAAEEKAKVSLTTKRNTESIEIHVKKQLKKEIAGDFLCAEDRMLFVDSKVSS